MTDQPKTSVEGATAAALRGASDTFIAALEELHRIEVAKRAEPPGTDRFVELARQARDLATEVLVASSSQEHLAEVAAAITDAKPDAVLTPIEDTPTPREVHEVLAEWREAERRLAAAEPGSTEAISAAADVRRLRTEYRTAHEAALRSQED